MLSIGDVLSLVMMDTFIKASVQANDAFVLFAVIFLVSGLLQHVSVGEVETNRERKTPASEATWQKLLLGSGPSFQGLAIACGSAAIYFWTTFFTAHCFGCHSTSLNSGSQVTAP